MIRHRQTSLVLLTVMTVLATGCHPVRPIYFGEDGDLSHYVGKATEIAYPDVQVESLPDAKAAQAPLTLANADFDNVWELTLVEASKLALTNSKVLKNLGGRVDAPSEQLLNNPDFATTVFTPALQETSPGFDQLVGPEAALSAFDAEFNSSVNVQKNDQVNNLTNFGTVGFLPQFLQTGRRGSFQAEIAKQSMSGGRFAFRNVTTYDLNNNPLASPVNPIGRLFSSDWRTNLEAEVRQPLLQGAGAQYNRIAGPFNPFGGRGTRNFDGVILARLRTDITLTDFEAGVRNLVRDVENAYWELYFTYRNLEARKVGMNGALKLWQAEEQKLRAGARDGGPEKEALAREQYYSFRADVESAKSNIFAAENRLRYLMGLAATDGRLIRPSARPTEAKVTFEWHDILGESLERSVELRRQKWRIEEAEMSLLASKNHLLPRLDAVGLYRWKGFGDDLLNPDSRGKGRFDNAANTLLHGDFQEWEAGLQLSFKLGFRQELAAVRHYQLRVARQKAVLQEQELELSHLVAEAVRQLDQQFQLIETNFNRRVAAQAQVDTFQVKIDLGIGSSTQQLQLLLDAQRRLAEAEAGYYRALVAYNRAITELHFRKGSLLEYNNVFLAEGPWPGKAYFDAMQLARQRDASLFLDHGITRPNVVSQGAYRQLGTQQTPEPQRLQQVPNLPPQPESIMTPVPEVLPMSAELELPRRSPGPTRRISSHPSLKPIPRRAAIQPRSSQPVATKPTTPSKIQLAVFDRTPVKKAADTAGGWHAEGKRPQTNAAPSTPKSTGWHKPGETSSSVTPAPAKFQPADDAKPIAQFRR